MYASQTKRLCVRGASSDETRVQHHSSEATPAIQQQQHNHSTSTLLSRQPVLIGTPKMVAPATGINSGEIENELESVVGHQQQPHYHFQDHPASATTVTGAIANPGASSEHELINKLAIETLEEAKLELLLSIRNLVTACNRKKDSIVSNPNFSKIVSLIDDDKPSSKVKTQLALLLCSVAKSGEHNVKVLNESLVDDKIFNLILNSQDQSLIEACLRCMRSVMSWPRVSRTWLLYGSDVQLQTTSNTPSREDSKETSLQGRNNLQKIITYAQSSNSFIIQECIADIFAVTCGRSKDQSLLHKASAIPCIVQLIESPSHRVIIASLNWLTQMCLKNHVISLETVKTKCPSGMPVLDRLTLMMSRDTCYELQFLSARCFAHIYRALDDMATNDLKDDRRIVSHVLPTLVRMTHRDKPPHLRVKSAECIAYLIECETRLQNTASVCDHLIESLANMLEYEQNSMLFDSNNPHQNQYKYSSFLDRYIPWLSSERSSQRLSQQEPPIIELRSTQLDSSKTDAQLDNCSELNQEMKRAAFLALASLASNLEQVRKKIFNTCSVMQHLVKSLTDSDNKTLKSVLTCLLSLSRSVQQLRTSFAENSVYSALKTLLTNSSKDVLILVLAILCNISLDFSPGKQHFLDAKTIDILCKLTKRSDSSVLRLHGMWILMNMVYQLKDQNLKFAILQSLDINHVLKLLETEEDEEMVLKTLGFLRNLLSHKQHIDAIMRSHGILIMQSLTRILDSPSSTRIKEQTLCVLTNIADGTESKALIMNNRIVLAYLTRIMCDEQAGDLRLAAICCITNLAHKEYEGSYERRDEMKKLGIEENLKSLLNTKDPILSDRVRTAYNQFLIGGDDKYVN